VLDRQNLFKAIMDLEHKKLYYENAVLKSIPIFKEKLQRFPYTPQNPTGRHCFSKDSVLLAPSHAKAYSMNITKIIPSK
jgi:hypothetical protein